MNIGYHSYFNPECNTERGLIDSLSNVYSIGVIGKFHFTYFSNIRIEYLYNGSL